MIGKVGGSSLCRLQKCFMHVILETHDADEEKDKRVEIHEKRRVHGHFKAPEETYARISPDIAVLSGQFRLLTSILSLGVVLVVLI
jgi:hypothetical protein